MGFNSSISILTYNGLVLFAAIIKFAREIGEEEVFMCTIIHKLLEILFHGERRSDDIGLSWAHNSYLNYSSVLKTTFKYLCEIKGIVC